ncbi:MAG TPA: BON domain-containing protein [Gemmatimonadaceae bacterium]|nr:BON domain-containing protein [Gemmatimonadaceae bacterium]
MARDYEDIHDLDDLSDDELRELVRNHLRDNDGIDSDDINVHVESGRVRLLGRVGTEAELRVAEHVLTDVLGLTDVSNELLVDSIRRAESPEAIDDHLADEAEREGLLLGDRPDSTSPEAEHLEEDLDARLYGTADVQKSIEEGTAWIPPTSPTPEGLAGTDADSNAYGEDH